MAELWREGGGEDTECLPANQLIVKTETISSLFDWSGTHKHSCVRNTNTQVETRAVVCSTLLHTVCSLALLYFNPPTLAPKTDKRHAEA